MPCRALPFSLVKRPGSPYWYYKLGTWKTDKSTGKKLKADAIEIATAALERSDASPSGPTLRKYAGFDFSKVGLIPGGVFVGMNLFGEYPLNEFLLPHVVVQTGIVTNLQP